MPHFKSLFLSLIFSTLCWAQPETLKQDFWTLTNQVLDQMPAVSSKRLESDLMKADGAVLDAWPVSQVEFLAGSASADQDLKFSLRQGLPYGTVASKQRALLQPLIKSSELSLKNFRQVWTAQILFRLYQFGRLEIEKEHLKERRERLQLIKLYITNFRPTSLGQKIDLDLLKNYVRSSQLRFDEMDLEYQQARNSLTSLNIQLNGRVLPRWISTKDLTDITGLIPKLNPSQSLEEKIAQFDLDAKKTELKYSSFSPTLEVVFQSERDRISRQNSNYLGLAVQIPWPQVLGHQADLARIKQKVAESNLSDVQRTKLLKMDNLKIHFSLLERSLRLYPMEDLHRLESKIDAAKIGLEKGLISATQFIELDRQIHDAIETTLQVQVDLVTTLLELSKETEINVTAIVGGQL